MCVCAHTRTHTHTHTYIQFVSISLVPGPVSVTNLCSAVIWQAPVNPNGIISGYDVDILGSVTRLPSTQLFFVTSETQREDNVFARVCIRFTYSCLAIIVSLVFSSLLLG